MTQRTITVNDVTLNVYDAGSGPVVLFAHGFPLNHNMWRHQLEALSTTHRVIAPDLRGFGGSTPAEGIITMEQFADDLVALLDVLEITEKVILCGLSMGGYIAFAWLRKNAERLGGLILCDTRPQADTDEAITNRKKLAASVLKHGSELAATGMPQNLFAESTFAQQPEVVEDIRQTIAKTDPKSIAAALEGMAERPDSTSLLPTIEIPTLVIVGTEDRLTSPADMLAMNDALPNSTFVEITNAGHMAPLEKPEPVNAAIKRFLASL